MEKVRARLLGMLGSDRCFGGDTHPLRAISQAVDAAMDAHASQQRPEWTISVDSVGKAM
jgi:hypothetical protein